MSVESSTLSPDEINFSRGRIDHEIDLITYHIKHSPKLTDYEKFDLKKLAQYLNRIPENSFKKWLPNPAYDLATHWLEIHIVPGAFIQVKPYYFEEIIDDQNKTKTP